MKYIKIIKNINRVLLAFTLVLYITIFLGLYSHIVLGAFQLLVGISLFYFWNRIQLKHKHRLMIYWFLVVLYGILTFFKVFPKFNNSEIFQFMIIPLTLAGYFTYLLEKFNLKE